MGNLETARHCLDARNARKARAIARTFSAAGTVVAEGRMKGTKIGPFNRLPQPAAPGCFWLS